MDRGATAGSLLVENVPRFDGRESAHDAVDRLCGNGYDSAEMLFVVGPDDRLRGIIGLAELLRSAPGTPLAELMRAPPAIVTGDVAVEAIVTAALDGGLASVPVVDPGGRLLGVVPPPAVLAALRGHEREEVAELEGTRRDDLQAHHALLAHPRERAGARLPWLIFGLVGSLVTTALMSRFERTLSAHIAVAFFVPGLGYLIDAVGTQTEAVVVRGMAVGKMRFARVFWGEAGTGLLLGLALGALAFGPAWWALRDLALAAAVAVTVLVGGTLTSVVALALPWLIKRLGRDPAFGSGPIATIITYVITLLVYFSAVRLMG